MSDRNSLYNRSHKDKQSQDFEIYSEKTAGVEDRHAKIMIVEDDEFLREELENIYHKAGYEVCCVTDFPETGAVCEAEHPDLLVLDLGLPGISGFALCKEIRKKGSFPILVLTSRDKMQDELKALELGADEYLTKPCHKDRLLARTENLLKRAMGNAHLLDGDDFLFDTRTYTVCQGKDACHIPENQGKILKILLEYAGTEVKKSAFQRYCGEQPNILMKMRFKSM